ncbi:gamma-glutamyltransferase [Mycolicibacterium sp. 3033]|nr:gamma-glutamyltransferase [Mycolicibacterium aurantiacum]
MPTQSGPTSSTGAAATPHRLATDAAVEVYRDGGTAIDAAIAAAAVLTVVYPHNVALGGDLVALVRIPDGTVTCVNASGWAGAAADPAAMRAAHGDRLPDRGADTVTVPGGVRGWEALQRLGSRLRWSRLLEPAERVARSGVPVAPSIAAHLLDAENADLAGIADFDAVFRPGGRPLREGQILRQPALADTFTALRFGGPDEFYTGTLGQRTVAYLRSRGSVLQAADFAEFAAELTEPLSTQFRGVTVCTSPPNTHGFVMLRALRALDALGVDEPLGDDLPTLMQIFGHANLLRTAHLADPRQADVDVDTLVGGDVTARATLTHTRDMTGSVPAGDTVGVAAADGQGFAVSLIQSVYHAFGSGLIDPQTGILFHDRGTSFDLTPASPNVLAPRKRPRHTLMPALTIEGGRLRHVLATMGGQGQPQILTEILLRMLDGAAPGDAVAAPRAIVGRQTHLAGADTISVEDGFDGPARAALARSDLDVIELPAHSESCGQANVVAAHADGSLVAASDPRSDGSAAVVHHVRLPR